jgi:hypothetical protein
MALNRNFPAVSVLTARFRYEMLTSTFGRGSLVYEFISRPFTSANSTLSCARDDIISPEKKSVRKLRLGSIRYIVVKKRELIY